MQERLLKKAKRQLGPEDSNTLSVAYHLAVTLTQVGDPARAVSLLEDSEAKRAETLGDDHPTTLATRQKLAAALRAAGKLDRARKLDQAVIASPLSPDHPTVLAARADLALILRAQRDLAGAKKQQDEVLALWPSTRGAEHPFTLQVRFQRAETLAAQGNLAAARAEIEAVDKLQVEKLGRSHPDTLATERALAGILERLKNSS